jgi:hypothetical protein
MTWRVCEQLLVFLLRSCSISQIAASTAVRRSVHAWKSWPIRYGKHGFYHHLYSRRVQTITDAIQDLSHQAQTQSLPGELLGELQVLLTSSTHRVAKARAVASKYIHRLITSFPSLMCDPPLVFSILEVLTLLRRSCEGEYVDEVCLGSASWFLY